MDATTALLKNGASVQLQDKVGQTALHWAAQHGHTEVVQLLARVRGIDIHATDQFGQTALHQAALFGHVACIAALANKDGLQANLEARNNLGMTPLALAAASGQLASVRALVKHGAKADVRDSAGQTPMRELNACLLTIMSHPPPRVYSLTSTCVCICPKCSWSMIMLFCADCSFVLWADMAAANGKLSMVKLLASREIDHRWTIRDKVGQTPMQLAKAHGHADIISFFSSMVQNQMAQLNKLHDAGALDAEELASALRPLLLQQAEGGTPPR